MTTPLSRHGILAVLAGLSVSAGCKEKAEVEPEPARIEAKTGSATEKPVAPPDKAAPPVGTEEEPKDEAATATGSTSKKVEANEVPAAAEAEGKKKPGKAQASCAADGCAPGACGGGG